MPQFPELRLIQFCLKTVNHYFTSTCQCQGHCHQRLISKENILLPI